MTQVPLKVLLFPAIPVTEWKLTLWTWSPHWEVLLWTCSPPGFRGLTIIQERRRARPGVTSYWIPAGVTVTLDRRRQAHQRETAQPLLISKAASSRPAQPARSLQNSVAVSPLVPSQPATLWRAQMRKPLQRARQSRVCHAPRYPPGPQKQWKRKSPLKLLICLWKSMVLRKTPSLGHRTSLRTSILLKGACRTSSQSLTRSPLRSTSSWPPGPVGMAPHGSPLLTCRDSL